MSKTQIQSKKRNSRPETLNFVCVRRDCKLSKILTRRVGYERANTQGSGAGERNKYSLWSSFEKLNSQFRQKRKIPIG